MKVWKRSEGLKASEVQTLVGSAPTILEIGANDGTDTVSFLEAMPGARIWAFEPEPRALGLLRARCGGDSRVTIDHRAISDEDGRAVWWASAGPPDSGDQEWHKSGSICRPTGHYHMSPEIGFTQNGVVETIRLDTWLALNWKPHMGRWIDFAWIDVQGAEAKLIRGGQGALSRVRVLYTEFYTTPMYEGQPVLKEIVEMLPGFRLVGLCSNNALFQNKDDDDDEPNRHL